jgi:hypothetical protein
VLQPSHEAAAVSAHFIRSRPRGFGTTAVRKGSCTPARWFRNDQVKGRGHMPRLSVLWHTAMTVIVPGPLSFQLMNSLYVLTEKLDRTPRFFNGVIFFFRILGISSGHTVHGYGRGSAIRVRPS